MAVAGKFNIHVGSLKQSQLAAQLRSIVAEPGADELHSESPADAEPLERSHPEA